MAGKGDDETLLEERLSELGLAITQGFAANATITPFTALTLSATSAPPRSSEGRATEEPPPQLPRISIGPPGRETSSSSINARRDYAIVAMLGEGGMGCVHLARQHSLARDVALKTLKPGALPAISEALLREARLTGALEHPGVIPVHALGIDDDGHPILVMKRVDGVELSALLHDDAHVAWRARGRSADRLVASIEILMHVCLTLEFAHSRGVIHCDVKPENVMVGGFGEVYLLDWGIASITDASSNKAAGSGPIVGTPAYMAPEMVLGQPVDVRTDVYLLGATLHEVLTGKPRHVGSTLIDVIRAAMKSAPFAYGAAVPEQLARLCNRTTAADPAERPASVGEVREALASFLRNRSARALCDTAVERLSALEGMLAATTTPTDGPPKNIADAYRLVTEARFGLTQSLREDASDPITRSAMRRCLIAAIELELRQGHADTADALLREMDPVDDEMVRRIAETRERAAVRDERLERLERDLDPTEHATPRTTAVIAMALAYVVIISIVLTRLDSSKPSSGVAGAGLATTVIVVGLVVLRRRLLAYAFNRRLAGLLVLLSVSILANRILGMVTGTPREQTIAIDLLIAITVVLAMAIAVLPQLAWCGPVLVIALAATRVWPNHGPGIFGAACIATLLVAAAVLARVRKASKRAGKPPS